MKSKTWNDPIVEEVRSAREDVFREANYDLMQLHARLVESQKRHGRRLTGKGFDLSHPALQPRQ